MTCIAYCDESCTATGALKASSVLTSSRQLSWVTASSPEGSKDCSRSRSILGIVGSWRSVSTNTAPSAQVQSRCASHMCHTCAHMSCMCHLSLCCMTTCGVKANLAQVQEPTDQESRHRLVERKTDNPALVSPHCSDSSMGPSLNKRKLGLQGLTASAQGLGQLVCCCLTMLCCVQIADETCVQMMPQDVWECQQHTKTRLIQSATKKA